MYSASSTSGRSVSNQSRMGESAANTRSVEQHFCAEGTPVSSRHGREYYPLATGDGHR